MRISKKKILIVAESVDVDDSSGSKANIALIFNLHKVGYEVKVYHYTRKDILLKGISTVAIRENRRSALFFLSRVERLLRHKLNLDLHRPLEKIFGFSFTLYNDRNSISSSLKKIKVYEPDLVVTLSKGGSFRPHHALLKIPKWHHKWLAYMHDPYPMHHYPKPFTWYEPGYEKKEGFVRAVAQNAAIAGFPSELLMEWMGKFYPEYLRTGVTIPHQILEQKSDKTVASEFFTPRGFNLLHAGNLLGARNPEGLLLAFQDFLQTNPEANSLARLVFIGGNNERVQKAAESNPNIVATENYVEFNKVLKMQRSAAVNIILEAKSDISPFLPGKFPHCVSADRPILLLGPQKSEARRLLGNSYPYWSEIDDIKKIGSLLKDLYLKWRNVPENFRLNRPDLYSYLSEPYLKKVVDGILSER